MNRIGIIGLGNMGSAILKALKDEKKWILSAYDENKDQMASWKDEAKESIEDLAKDSDVVIIAVKPDVITPSFLENIKSGPKGFVSIAAGVEIPYLEKHLSSKNISRFMPNIAARMKKAATAISFSKEAEDEFKSTATGIARSFGDVFPIKEEKMNAFTAISGSFIAYALLFLDASAYGGVKVGMSYKDALSIVKSTTESALSLLSEGGTPGAIIPQVCSAGGTTVEGITKLYETGFQDSIVKAIDSTYQKARKMEEEKRK